MTRRTVVACATTLLLFLSTSSFHAQSATVGFKLTYCSRVDGAVIRGLATDGNGLMWAVGYTTSASMATTPDALQPRFAGGSSDVFLEHIRPDGTVLYRTFLGGGSADLATGIALDPQGNIYVVGQTSSSDFPTSAAVFDRTCGSGGPCTQADGFVMKLSPDGRSLIYSAYLGGTSADQPMAVAVDDFGRAHVVGTTTSPDYPTTANAVRTTQQFTEVTYSRVSADGSMLEYSTLLGGSGQDNGYAVAVDDAGDAFVTGSTSSPDFTTRRPLQPTFRAINSSTAFLAKFTDAGLDFATYLGGSRSESGTAVAVSTNAVYVGGFTSSTDFPGASRPANKDAGGFITAITLDGTVLQRTALLDASGADLVERIAVDGSDVVFVAGTTFSSDFPRSSDAPQKLYGGAGDNFVAVVPMTGISAGAITWSSYLGGAWEEHVYGLTLDGAGGFMFGGMTFGGYPTLNGSTPSPQTEGTATLAHFMAPQPENIVLYAKDASTIVGDWRLVSDPTAAGGMRIWNPDAGAPKVATPAGNPASYFELTFNAFAGVPYHLWIRMKADNDSFQNDSVFVQFNDTMAVGGSPHWLIGTTGATTVSLEDCNGCGEQAWGWNDNGYNTTADPVTFFFTGQHRIRIQQREDGVSIDQIILSSATWQNAPPGANRNDTTIVPQDITAPPSNHPPAVSLTSPANGTTFTATSRIPIAANASDSDGIVERVDFYADSTLLWTSTSAPYGFSWESAPAGTYTLTAVATDNSGAATRSNAVSITITPSGGSELPPFFTDGDIGDVGVAGSATYGDGTFTVQGSGADVWGTADAFHYVSEPLSGDGAIIARVATVSGESTWVKAGVMIRASASPDSAQAFMLVSHAKGVCFQRRVSDGNLSASTCGSASTAPRWVKLVRTGNIIAGYESANGTTWTMVGRDTFTMLRGADAGIAVSSHIKGTLSTATFDHVSVTEAPGANRAPLVSVTSPSNGATFTAPATVSIGVNSVDTDGTIEKIDFYANSTLIGTVAGRFEEDDYQLTWSNVAAGTYTLTAVATDNDGATTTSSPVSITVNDGPPPGDQCSSVTLSRTFFYSGGPSSTWQIDVAAPTATCTWTASIDQAWLLLNGATGPTTITGTGPGRVTLQTLDNRTGANRSGTFTIGGAVYSVTQEPF